MGKESRNFFGVIGIFMFAYTTAANSTVAPATQISDLIREPFCRDSTGTHQAGDVWQPDHLTECVCTPELFFIQCRVISGCRDAKFKLRQPKEEWLTNPTSKCSCDSNLITSCEILLEPACMDISGKVRRSMETWMNNSCVKCACFNGSITCFTYDVKITYGLFEVNVSPTCEHCVISEQTSEKLSACQAFFRMIDGKKLMECASQGFYIKNAHRCNGINDCPDWSDEQGCEDVKCRDDAGDTLLIPQHGWHVTPCLVCHCRGGLTSCKRTLEINFPAHVKGVYQLEETCTQPFCSVLRFIKEKKDACEGTEVIKDGGILMKGQIWNSSGCNFYFDGAILQESGPVCPPMARAACYIYNGAICCATQCPALLGIMFQTRGGMRICGSGHQLVSADKRCPNSNSQCFRAPNLQSCFSEVTCQDEDSNTYFEGVTWSVGDCIQCSCNRGNIYCSREISVLTSLRKTIIDHCNQTQCDVARFVEKNKGICKACRWNGKLYFDGDQWKENGVDFYCSGSNPNVRPGCYAEYNRVRCTGAIKGIRNLSLISKEKLFLCESGDEIRSFNDRCNLQPDCDDQSDERNCDHYYCAAETKFGFLWTRTVIGQRLTKQCSLVDPTWTGVFSANCTKGVWKYKEKCDCENRSVVEMLNQKISAVNGSNFMDMLKTLSDSKGSFINANIFYEMLRDLFHTAKTLLTPITSNNSDQVIQMFELVSGIAYSLNDFYDDKRSPFCRHDLVKEGFDLSKQALAFLRQAPFNTTAHHYGSALSLAQSRGSNLGGERSTSIKGNFVPNIKTFLIRRRLLVLQLNTAPIIPPIGDEREKVRSRSNLSEILNINSINVTDSKTVSIKIQRKRTNTTHELTNQQITKALEEKNCSWVSFDKEKDVFIIDNPYVSKTKLKHFNIQEYLELVLLCISIAAVFVSLTLLFILRIKLCERIFVHKNLLLSLGLGNLVYVLDKTLFTTRKENPALCSTVAVIQHFLHTALFTWMLVEGINLYIKLVKVFSVNKQYLAYAGIGWGIPAIIVGLVAAIKPSTYDMGKTFYQDVMCGSLKLTAEIERTRCWINGSLWIYKGPVLAILLVNLVLFVILLRVIYGKIATKYGKSNVKVARRGLRSTIALLPLLGVTWLLGFVMHFHDALVYVFILLTSTQGVIFCIFHCVLDDQVRDALRSLRSKKRTDSRTGTTPASNPATTPVMERKTRVNNLQLLEDGEGRKTGKMTSSTNMQQKETNF